MQRNVQTLSDGHCYGRPTTPGAHYNTRCEYNLSCASEARALRARKTFTPRFTDFFTDFEEKPDCFAVYLESFQWKLWKLANAVPVHTARVQKDHG